MKAYSNDFRQKIVESNRRDFESIQQTAARFHVSYSFVWKLIKGYEQTGLVSTVFCGWRIHPQRNLPKPHGGGAKPKLNSSQLGVVAQLNEQKNDATLEELAIQLEETIGVRVSRATMGRVVLKLKLTRKKNFARNRARNRAGTAVASPVLAWNWSSKIRKLGIRGWNRL